MRNTKPFRYVLVDDDTPTVVGDAHCPCCRFDFSQAAGTAICGGKAGRTADILLTLLAEQDGTAAGTCILCVHCGELLEIQPWGDGPLRDNLAQPFVLAKVPDWSVIRRVEPFRSALFAAYLTPRPGLTERITRSN